MKCCFVLDENVIVFAQKGENAQGDLDPTCLELLWAIERQCHSVLLTAGIWAKYSRHIDGLSHSPQLSRPVVMPLIKSLLTNAEKQCRVLAEQELEQIEGINRIQGIDAPDRDDLFVRVAATIQGSILVSADERLLNALISHEIPGRYGFDALAPVNALRLALAES